MTEERLRAIEQYATTYGGVVTNTAVIALIAEVRRLREENERLRKGALDEGEMM